MTLDEIAALCGSEKARQRLFLKQLLEGITQLQEGIAKAKADLENEKKEEK